MLTQEDFDKLVRREFGLGAAELPGRIHHCKDPRLPQFEFEWHPGSQKVYRKDNPGAWIDGEWVPAPPGSVRNCPVIAEHCLTHAQFFGFVQTFCRAYLLACKHSAEGRMGHLAPDRQVTEGGDPCPTR